MVKPLVVASLFLLSFVSIGYGRPEGFVHPKDVDHEKNYVLVYSRHNTIVLDSHHKKVVTNQVHGGNLKDVGSDDGQRWRFPNRIPPRGGRKDGFIFCEANDNYLGSTWERAVSTNIQLKDTDKLGYAQYLEDGSVVLAVDNGKAWVGYSGKKFQVGTKKARWWLVETK